uniref:Uncharacterized protein n=1 Tax=Onchocerca volvulus TaxID=6282 RepID=A0A8R1TSY4_ONCVO
MTVCSSSSTNRNTIADRYNDNFANVLRQIENETQRDLRRQHLLDQHLRVLTQEPKRFNPLRYQLIPPRYRMKHKGYAVCRLCAERSRRQAIPPTSTNFGLTDYLHENSPEHSERITNEDECYFPVELGCCLARLTRLILTSVKVLKELKFLSGNMYPMLSNDITYLDGLYLRIKSNYTQYRALRIKRFTTDNKILPSTRETSKLRQKSEDSEVNCDLTKLEDTIDEGNKRYFDGDSSRSLGRSKSDSDFEQHRTRKHRFPIGSKWKRDE